MKLLHDYILVKAEEPKRESKGGIVLPNRAAAGGHLFGAVMHVGPGSEKEPMVVKPGDRVMFKHYDPDMMEVDGVDLLLIDVRSVIAVLD